MAKILIVDDSKIMRMNLKKVFTNLEHDVVAEASDGIEAIEAYKTHQPDIVTMDITMPNMDGIQAVEEIIKFDANAQIVMVSSHGQKDMVIDAISKGAKHYILKPIKQEIVEDVLEKIII